jgi:WD40 repeat protein/tRNA A-37 threonylcarbamoyl transferase component Bud32
MMTGTKICRRCGESIPPGVLSGNCPRCLVALALSTAVGESADIASEPNKSFPSTRFFGDYEILGEIARGGMGVVYRARQVSLNRPVALKMIAAGQLATPAQVQRFRLEAEAAARLDHPNIVPIYEIGEHERQHFYSMKLIEGGSLAERISDFGFRISGSQNAAQAASQSAIASLISKIARAVHYAHQRGILHRDLKPTNILIDTEGEPHITDFGLAKLIEDDASLTQTVAVLGTPAYMAPELASGNAAQATTAADIYSLGAILYELLIGRPPFIAENVPTLLRRITEEEPQFPSAWRIERDLTIICLKCLEKDPARRCTSARALAEDLERWLAGEPILARPASGIEKFSRWCRRKPALAAVSSALVCALIAGLAGIIWQWQRAANNAKHASHAAAQARDELWGARLAQARAQRLSGLAGRKSECLAAVKSAAAIHSSAELRDEAIAALALTDVIEEGLWHSANVYSFEQPAFSSDLEFYALGGSRGEVSVFRTSSGEKLLECKGPSLQTGGVRFSPDAQLVGARFGNGEIAVWNRTNGVRVFQWSSDKHIRSDTSFDLSPDTRTIAVAGDTNGVRLFNLADGKEALMLPFGECKSVSFSPNGERLAIAAASNVVVWSFAENRVTHVLPHPDEVGSLAWHPDGRRLASSCSRGFEVWLWETERTNCVILKGHLELITHLNFNHRGSVLMSTAWDGSTRFWNAGSGELLFVSRAGFGLQFSDDDTRIGFAREREGLGTWKFSPSLTYRTVHLPIGSTRHVAGFDLGTDGRWILAANADGMHLCDAKSGAPIAYASHRNNRSVWFTTDAERAVLVGADHLHTWKLVRDGNEIQLQDKGRLELQPRVALDAGSVTHGGQHLLIAASMDQVFCADLSAPEHWWVLRGNGLIGPINFAAISPDTNWIATTYWKDRGTFLWDTRTQQRVHNFGAAGGFVAFSPDSRTLLVGSAHNYALWEIGTWRRVWEIPRHSAGELVGRAAFSPDGRMIALCSEVNLVQLVNAATGEKLATLQAPLPKNIGMVAFSSDGETLGAATFDTEIQLWDLRAMRKQLTELDLDWPSHALIRTTAQ